MFSPRVLHIVILVWFFGCGFLLLKFLPNAIGPSLGESLQTRNS